MNERDWADRFSHDVDSLLSEAGRTDSEPTPTEYRQALDLARTLAATDFSMESRVRQALRRRLLNRVGTREERQRRNAYPVRSSFWRRRSTVTLTAVLAVFFLIATVLLILPEVRGVAARSLEAGMEIVLQRVRVREAKPQWRWELPASEVSTYATMAEAQEHVDFPIREPAYLPPGFRLEGVQVPNASSVMLGYRRETEDRGIELLYLLQSSLAGKVDSYADYPGEIREIELQGRRAVWGTDRHRVNLLLWEDKHMVFVLYSTLPLTEMQNVAISLFDD